MTQSQLPRIDRLTRHLSSDNLRVASFLDTLVASVDDIAKFAAKKDWEQTKLLTKRIAQQSEGDGNEMITEAAHGLCSALDHPENELEIRRRVVKLIAVCRRNRRATKAT